MNLCESCGARREGVGLEGDGQGCVAQRPGRLAAFALRPLRQVLLATRWTERRVELARQPGCNRQCLELAWEGRTTVRLGRTGSVKSLPPRGRWSHSSAPLTGSVPPRRLPGTAGTHRGPAPSGGARPTLNPYRRAGIGVAAPRSGHLGSEGRHSPISPHRWPSCTKAMESIALVGASAVVFDPAR
jgi:hypothetical protein